MLVSTASHQYRLSGMPRIYSGWFGGVRFLGYPDDMSWFERSRSAIYQNTIWFAKASVVLQVPSPITSMVNFYGSHLGRPTCFTHDATAQNRFLLLFLCLRHHCTCASGWVHRNIPIWGNYSAVRDICEYNARFYSYFYS